ncbi:MAG: prepilin-type N-terminal cleavage/methylation domain-containing protein [Candidatus Hydrogenedens sp.]|nr:prepilin-type N-terminal cleavage/methylation domain-containing protein [Candidatus Hydrogenedens sp.]
MTKQRGFTLIELMIVVSIIAIICAIAVNNLLRSRVQANEASAIEDLSVITSAQISYNAAHEVFAEFDALTDDSNGPAFLDDGWVEGRDKSGYVFSIQNAGTANFACTAEPLEPGSSGVRRFYVDASGVIRYNFNGAAGPDDPAVGQ